MVIGVTFTVWPTGRQFKTFVREDDFSDFDRVYYESHLAAAILATSFGCESYVTTGNSPERCAFQKGEYLDPNSTLRRIMMFRAMRSYWDFETRSWHPLRLDPELDQGHILAKRLLPPPKRII